MTGFHMHMSGFRRDYLEKWLSQLAGMGFDAVLWEDGDDVRWDTCPECAAPEAFSKQEYRELIEFSRSLGLEPIPLLRALAHNGHVLRHEAYAHLAECRSEWGQYCPTNPDVLKFLGGWIEEYLDVFGEVRHFHLGMDEAHWLGRCDNCRSFVEQHSVSRLLADHVNAVSAPLIERGIVPIVWADMLLQHHEEIGRISRKVMLFDWRYDMYQGVDYLEPWGHHPFRLNEIPRQYMAEFGAFLFPHGREPGRIPDAMHSAEYLAARGFKVVGCPASSCYRDSAFATRHWLHAVNTFDWFKKGMQPNMNGTMITSWGYLTPYEQQISALDVPGWILENPGKPVESFQRDWQKKRFGVDGEEFWTAAGLLAEESLFTGILSLRHCTDDRIETLLRQREDSGKTENWRTHPTVSPLDSGEPRPELEKSRECLADYRRARDMLDTLAKKATSGQELLALWDRGARNMINRARAAILILEAFVEQTYEFPENDPRRNETIEVLEEMKTLREESDRLYAAQRKPGKKDEIVALLYDSVECALKRLAPPNK